MEKVGCCLQEALGKEASMADKVGQLEQHMQTKRLCRTCLTGDNVHVLLVVMLSYTADN